MKKSIFCSLVFIITVFFSIVNVSAKSVSFNDLIDEFNNLEEIKNVAEAVIQDNKATISLTGEGETYNISFINDNGILKYDIPKDRNTNLYDLQIISYVVEAYSNLNDYDYKQVSAWLGNNDLTLEKDGIELNLYLNKSEDADANADTDTDTGTDTDMGLLDLDNFVEILKSLLDFTIEKFELDLENGLKTFDPNIDYISLYGETEDILVPTTGGQKFDVSDFIGKYEWTEEIDLNDGTKHTSRITLILNENGTAEYDEEDGKILESTSGTYEYKDGKIIYTRKNYNDADKTDYTLSDKVEEFEIVDKDNLKKMYNNTIITLKRVTEEKTENNPNTGIENNYIIYMFGLIGIVSIYLLLKKYSKFSMHS